MTEQQISDSVNEMNALKARYVGICRRNASVRSRINDLVEYFSILGEKQANKLVGLTIKDIVLAELPKYEHAMNSKDRAWVKSLLRDLSDDQIQENDDVSNDQ